MDTMNAIEKWLRNRQAASDARAFRRGFNWAAGELLREDATPQEIESLTFHADGPFDKGATAATNLLVSKYGIADNRVYR